MAQRLRYRGSRKPGGVTHEDECKTRAPSWSWRKRDPRLRCPHAIHPDLCSCRNCFCFIGSCGSAATYNVGPGQTYASIGAVPLATLMPGDVVRIHYRAQPYREKWLIYTAATAATRVPTAKERCTSTTIL